MTSTKAAKMTADAARYPDEVKEKSANTGQREIRYQHSSDLGELLHQAQCTLLISTYQAGKLVVMGSHQNHIAMSFHNFDRPMGVAATPNGNRLAVAVRDRIWLLRNVRNVAKRMDPQGVFDACYLTRQAHVTGEIRAHEMSWIGDKLWIVNTLFSCLCTLDANYSFVPRWQPPFISRLAAEDRCHLNGLTVLRGRPKFVTAMAETDSPGGWRDNKVHTGCVIDCESGETIARGFAMPHSPRIYNGDLWLLDSGRGSLVRLNANSRTAEVVAKFPGYTRGLAIHGHLAFIGLSRIRETSTFGGVPIAEHRDELKCGIGVVDLQRGKLVGQFEFKTGVEEIFEVTVLPKVQMTAMRGPFALDDGDPTIWVVPEPKPADPAG